MIVTSPGRVENSATASVAPVSPHSLSASSISAAERASVSLCSPVDSRTSSVLMSSPDVHILEHETSSPVAAAVTAAVPEPNAAFATAIAPLASAIELRVPTNGAQRAAHDRHSQDAAGPFPGAASGRTLVTQSLEQADEAAAMSLAAAAAALSHDPAVLHTATSLVPADMVVGDAEALWAAADGDATARRRAAHDAQQLTELASLSADRARNPSQQAPRAQHSLLQAAASMVPKLLSMLSGSPLSKARKRTGAPAPGPSGTMSSASGSSDGAAEGVSQAEDVAKLDALVLAAVAEEGVERAMPTVRPARRVSESSVLGSAASSSSSPQGTPGARSASASEGSSGSFFGSESKTIPAVTDRHELAAEAAWFGTAQRDAGVRFAEDAVELSSNRGSHGHHAAVRRRWSAAAAAGRRLSPPHGVSKGLRSASAVQKDGKRARKRCAVRSRSALTCAGPEEACNKPPVALRVMPCCAGVG